MLQAIAAILFVLVVVFTSYLFIGGNPDDEVYNRILREEGTTAKEQEGDN